MQPATIAKTILGPLVIAVLVGGGWWMRETWKAWLVPPVKENEPEAKSESGGDGDKVKISKQAQQNLRLDVKPINPTTYWRKIYLPGTVVDRPGHSDRGITAPIAGVITQVTAVPGKTVEPGAELFRLRIASESFQNSQMDLYKYTREQEINDKERIRLKPAVENGSVAPTKLLELDYQHDRFKALIEAHRQDLLTRQLTKEQVSSIEKGIFVTEVIIRMPQRLGKVQPPKTSAAFQAKTPVEYEVQELRVNLGDHVQAGQILAYLADHRSLYIEGKALKQESKLLALAAREGWPVEAEFSEDDDESPGERLTDLKIEFLGHTMDANGLTLPVFIPFDNPQKESIRDGKVHHSGQYRPHQKVLLKVAVAKLTDVFVLPVAGVVREGPEAYVFRQNGAVFDRTGVHVLMEDSDVVVIANDGQIVSGNYIAQNGAAALNRVLKASQAGPGGGHSHDH
jgi:multidrug efflux pump subunit AcrA (membrane-fusion protein)